MPAIMFYRKPVALNRQAHRNVKMRGAPSYAFAAKTSSVPLTGSEFAAAARSLPILFVPDANKSPTPVVLLGLHKESNLFVDAEGRWTHGYVPAFVRRYPFVLIDKGTPGDFMVGIDEDFAGFDADDGEPLFDAEGKEGPALKRAIEFLNAYQAEAKKTADFLAELQRLDLLIPRVINVTQKDGPKFQLNGFSMVDEAKLVNLGEKDAAGLLRKGYMGWIYMHLLSIGNISDLTAKIEAGKQAA
jgi:hypothetical protein